MQKGVYDTEAISFASLSLWKLAIFVKGEL